MKKTLSLVLVCVMLLGLLTACGAKKPMEIVKEGYLAFNTEVTIDEMAQYVLYSEAASSAYYEDREIDGVQYTNLYFLVGEGDSGVCISFQHGENETFSLYEMTTTDEDGLVYKMSDDDTVEFMNYFYSLVIE